MKDLSNLPSVADILFNHRVKVVCFIQNMYHRNYEPTIPTLQALCKAFGISLSQFFAVGELADVTEEQREILSLWNRLSDEQKSIVRALMGNMITEKK